MVITIKDKTFNLKRTFRSLIAYESAMGKAFNPTTVTDFIMYFYCVITASDEELELSFDEFMEWLDENPKELTNFTEWVIKISDIESTIAKKKTVKTAKK